MMEATNVINPPAPLASHSPYLYLSPSLSRSHTQTNNKTRPRESFAHMLETCICLEGILARTQMLPYQNKHSTHTDRCNYPYVSSKLSEQQTTLKYEPNIPFKSPMPTQLV